MTHLDPKTSTTPEPAQPTEANYDTVGWKIASWLIGGALTALLVVVIAWVIAWLLSNFPQIGG